MDRDWTVGGVDFGQVTGRAAQLYTIKNNKIQARITDYGGILIGRIIGGVFETEHDMLATAAGCRHLQRYEGSFGALLGRNANRIAGGSVTIDGKTFSLSKNENGSTLHGGAVGFGKQFWSVVVAEHDHVTLNFTSPDGDQGFPGRVDVTATYRLAGAALHLTFDAYTTKPTPLSLSAHPYFNLDGVGARDCLDHCIEIFAEAFLPTDEKQIPTGERRSVAGTAFAVLAEQRENACVSSSCQSTCGFLRCSTRSCGSV